MSIHLNNLLDNERLLLQLIALGSSIGAIIANLEWLKLAKHFKNGGIYSSEVREVRLPQIVNKQFVKFLSFLFSYPNILLLFILKLILIGLLFFTLDSPVIFGITCIFLVVLAIIISIRGNEGTTGADQINTITLLIVGLCILSPSELSWRVGIIFLALQLIIAYSTSGWIRILQPTWRNGEDLLVVLRQHTYGNRFIWNIGKKYPKLIKYTSLSILIFESIALLIVFMPIKVVVLYLSIGIVFHLLNAIIMGLNTFVWSFIPLYLSYFWVANELNKII